MGVTGNTFTVGTAVSTISEMSADDVNVGVLRQD